MEQNRTLIILLLCFVTYLLYVEWQKDYAPKPVVTAPAASGGHAAMPTLTPSTQMPAATPTTNGAGLPAVSPTALPAALQGQRIQINTDVYRAQIDTLGGDLSEVDLTHYPVHFKKKNEPFRLMETTPQRFFVAQSGWHLQDDPDNHTVPGSHTIYSSEKTEYKLTQGDKDLQVDLHWKNPAGVEFIKRYVFHRDSYVIDVKHIVTNLSDKGFKADLYLRLQRSAPEKTNGFFMLPIFVGPVYYSPDQKYHKIKFSDIDEVKTPGVKDAINRDISGGWAAVIEQFFVGAWIPDPKQSYKYFTSKVDDNSHRYMIGMVTEQDLAPGQHNAEDTARLYVGPKLQNQLAAIAPGLELSVDYGWLTFISKPLFWGLDHINRLVHNWGWSIILLTILIKLVFYKLSETSYRSMANMKRVAPRMQAMKERYGDDKAKLQQAMMELYKTEKINPLGGCLPIVIQIPVFMGLYYVLIESVELRQAPWIFWIEDLSLMDPYFVLPIIMGITMVIQQKLNPAPVDPLQAKIMMVLPLMFTVMFAVFPAGLVLYWVVNNVLSITQQWYITNHVIREEKHTAGHHGHKPKQD
ncbi:MAG: membrane protein insertase YidC [Gammaproteobacteria bacterium]|nr:membrane protein insertase YidC [Gammaproteobacteria bacterium]